MQKRAFGRRREDVVPFAAARVDRDQEFDLLSLWLVLRRQWIWLLAGLLVGLLAAAVHLFLAVPVYESRASIAVGKLNDAPLEDPDALAARLMEQYGQAPAGGSARLKEVAKLSRQNAVLALVTVGDSPEAAREHLASIVDAVLQHHERIFQVTVEPLQRRIDTIDDRIGQLRAQAVQLEELVGRLRDSAPGQAAVIAIEKGEIYPELTQLERDRLDLQREVNLPQTAPSKVVNGAALRADPVAPQRGSALGVGAVVGLALGLLVVFVREFAGVAQSKLQVESRSVRRANG